MGRNEEHLQLVRSVQVKFPLLEITLAAAVSRSHVWGKPPNFMTSYMTKDLKGPGTVGLLLFTRPPEGARVSSLRNSKLSYRPRQRPSQ